MSTSAGKKGDPRFPLTKFTDAKYEDLVTGSNWNEIEINNDAIYVHLWGTQDLLVCRAANVAAANALKASKDVFRWPSNSVLPWSIAAIGEPVNIAESSLKLFVQGETSGDTNGLSYVYEEAT